MIGIKKKSKENNYLEILDKSKLTNFEKLHHEIKRGIEGKNKGIPMGFDRLNKYIGIRKSMYYLIGGLTGSGKCLAINTLVLMYDGTYKKVQDISVNDKVMTPNGYSTVTSVNNGTENMYEIQQNRGISYTVNESHILSLKPSGERLINKYGKILNISVKDYLKLPNHHKLRLYGYKEKVNFNEQKVPTDPYMIGLWLGDGTSSKPNITNTNVEVIDYIKKYAKSINNKIVKKSITYSIVKTKEKSVKIKNTNKVFNSVSDAAKFVNRDCTNISEAIKKGIKSGGHYWEYADNSVTFFSILKSLDLLNNKHIPFVYSRNSEENRLKLLAGLIDSDGYYTNNAGFEINQKNKNLANDIVWICRSLGFYTSIVEKETKMKRKDGSIYTCLNYRISLYGDISKIPTLIKRKQASKNNPNKNNLKTRINVVSKGKGNYYGFELSGEKLFFLKDFTVTHNTSFIDDAFVLNPFDWYFKNGVKNKTTDIKLKIIYRSMERSRTYKLAKWLSRKIFIDTGIELQVSKLLGWTVEKLSKEELSLIEQYQDYMDAMEQVIEIIDGAENPVGIAKDIRKYAEENGSFKKIPYGEVYTPNDENLITLVVIDHIGLLKVTKMFSTKKESIDKMSDECRYFRDTCGFSFIVVSQFNRSIANPIRIKQGDVEPQLEDFKESANTQDDADVVLTLFDPIRYKVEDPSGYDLEKLRDAYGAKFFRSLRLIKNSYGEDDIRVGLAFMGSIGYFKEMPKRREITAEDYELIINKSYFLK